MADDGGVVEPGATAVVTDRVPLLRTGLVTALRLADVATVERCDGLDSAVDAVRRHRARLLVAGSTAPEETDALVRRVPAVDAAVLALVGQADRADLVALLEAGVAGVALRTVTPEDLAGMARSVLGGERAIAPPLLSLLLRLHPSARSVPSGAERVSLLTTKELQVLAHLAEGRSNAAIAEALFISPATVKSHLASIYAKLEVRTRHEATSRAVALGLLH